MDRAKRSSSDTLAGLLPEQGQRACAQVKALRMVAGVAAMLLTRFPTTLEQDRRALAGGPEGGPELPPDVRAAVQLRAEKKAVLSEVLQDIGHRIRVRPSCHL